MNRVGSSEPLSSVGNYLMVISVQVYKCDNKTSFKPFWLQVIVWDGMSHPSDNSDIVSPFVHAAWKCPAKSWGQETDSVNTRH